MININITLLIQLVNFLLVYFLLKKLFFEPLLEMMDRRKLRLDSLSSGFASEKAELTALENEYQEKLAVYLGQASAIRAQSKADAESFIRQELEKTETMAEAEFQKRKQAVDEELSKVMSALNAETAGFVKSVVHKFA